MTKRLTLAVKGIYFDQIRRGEKVEEYRVFAKWQKRLVNGEFDEVEITLGYPKKNDASRRMVFPWRGYTVRKIIHPHFGAEPVKVFAIRVGKES